MKIKLSICIVLVILAQTYVAAKTTSNQLFQIISNPAKGKVDEHIKNATFLELNFDELEKLRSSKPSLLNISIPVSAGQEVSFDLHDAKILADNFNVTTEKNEKVNYKPGLFYQGTITGITPSMAAWSLFDNSVMAVFSYNSENYMLGLWKDELNEDNSIYILYKESDILFSHEFQCAAGDLPAAMERDGNDEPHIQSNQCIKLYFECDYQLFLDQGSAVNVTNYVTGIFNVVQLIYNNESINTEISEIYVWTSTDPYNTNATSLDYLNDFKTTRTTFNGDLAHLLTTRPLNLGGIAGLGVLCDMPNAYAFNNIYNTYNQYPDYSLTVLIIAHELGHNLGSQHTHWCGWPGGPIDNCVPVDDGPCTAGPSPGTIGGTIMSYCHNTGLGTSFTNGFGPLPGNVIRNTYNSASCLTACTSPPKAAFTASAVDVCTVPATITFTDESFYTITSWKWDINNDGVVDYTTQSPTHTYNAGGVYTVKLIVTSANGSDTIVKTNYIGVGTFTPAVSIATTTGSDSICNGASVNFTATPTNGGNPPDYQWYSNGVAISGQTNVSYFVNTLANNDVITCQMSSNIPCPSPSGATSNAITMSVTPTITPEILIATSTGSAMGCTGQPVTFLATITNGGSAPSYQWKVNGINTGTNSNSLTLSSLANGDVVTCLLTSNAVCPSPSTVASNNITMIINPIVTPTVSVAITSGTNPTCAASPMTFTATSTHGGSFPIYQWAINGVNTIVTNSYTPDVISDGDVVTCTLISNASCTSVSTVTSTSTIISLIPSPTPSVAISISSGVNPICSGQSVTYTATATNAGTNPVYQWYINGTEVPGAQNQLFTPATFTDGDEISCEIVSGAACPDVVLSASITEIVPPISTVTFVSDMNICGGDVDSTVFLSNPSGATYAWTNSNTAIGIGASGTGSIPSFQAVNTGNTPITATIVVTPSIGGCVGIPDSYTITVKPTPVITQSGTTLTSSTASSYQWYLDLQEIPGATNQTYTTTQSGDYFVIVNNSECPSEIVTVTGTGVLQLNENCFFTVYPNPNNGNFTVAFEVLKTDTYVLQLVNALGELVSKDILTDFQGKYSKQFTIEGLSQGIYMIHLTGSNSDLAKKVIIQN